MLDQALTIKTKVIAINYDLSSMPPNN